MAAYSALQQAEFASEADGYTAVRHQREVGTGYFDAVASAVAGGQASTTALTGSTESAQFRPETKERHRAALRGGSVSRVARRAPSRRPRVPSGARNGRNGSSRRRG
jgi:hypothetical protein